MARALARLFLIAAATTSLTAWLATSPARADQISAKRATAQKLAAQIHTLQLRQSQLAEAYDRARLHAQDVATRLAAARANLSATDAALVTARTRVRDLAITDYMHGGRLRQLSIVVPNATDELAVRSVYVRAVSAESNDAVDALRQAHAQYGEVQAQLASDEAAAAKSVAEVDSARREINRTDAALQAQLARVRGELSGLVAAADRQRRVTEREAVKARWRDGSAIGYFPPPSAAAGRALAAARSQLGKPYSYGGAGPDSYDCSGLTMYAWGAAGRGLPHSAAAQYDVTAHIPISALVPGDLVFYGSYPHHVGIYVGGGEMINSLHPGAGVEYDSIYMEGDLIGGGRVY